MPYRFRADCQKESFETWNIVEFRTDLEILANVKMLLQFGSFGLNKFIEIEKKKFFSFLKDLRYETQKNCFKINARDISRWCATQNMYWKVENFWENIENLNVNFGFSFSFWFKKQLISFIRLTESQGIVLNSKISVRYQKICGLFFDFFT